MTPTPGVRPRMTRLRQIAKENPAPTPRTSLVSGYPSISDPCFGFSCAQQAAALTAPEAGDMADGPLGTVEAARRRCDPFRWPRFQSGW